MSMTPDARLYALLVQPAETGRPAGSPRLDGIDVLRGLSVLSVILLHVNLLLSGHEIQAGKHLPDWLAGLLFRNGYGVATFFTVSGFLITLTSLRRFGRLSAIRPIRFYRIRFARIAPTLLFLLFVLSILHLAHASWYRIQPQVTTLPRALVAAVTFHLNWLQATHGWLPPSWSVLWSLSVEEVFYSFFPLLCVTLFYHGWRRIAFITILGSFVVLGPFARSVFTTNPIWKNESYLSSMDGIALGCLCALLVDRTRGRMRANQRWLLVFSQGIGAGLMFFIAVQPGPSTLTRPILTALDRTGMNNTVLMVGACFIIFGSALRSNPGRPWTAPIRWFGRHSYEIYLTHEFAGLTVVWLLLKLHRGPIALWLCMVLAGAAALGYMVSQCISEPANRALRGAP